MFFLELLNTEEYLSYTIPYITHSPHYSDSKSSTKAGGDPPSEVRLWDSFPDKVNSYTFEQVRKFKKPNFLDEYVMINVEIVRNASNTNVCMVFSE